MVRFHYQLVEKTLAVATRNSISLAPCHAAAAMVTVRDPVYSQSA
jgi:hypothetical protein